MSHGSHPSHPHSSVHGYHHRKRSAAMSPSLTFIKRATGPAQASEKATGVPASVTIAQAILESGWGQHHIGEANNYFGVKAQKHADGSITFGSNASGYVEVPTHEYVGGKKVTVQAPFRKYAGMTGSFKDHAEFLRNNSRYSKALAAYAADGDAAAFAHGLQKAGYATDPHYAKLLIGIMKSHNLYQYDAPRPDAGKK